GFGAAGLLQFVNMPFHSVAAVGQAGIVGDLDVQAGTGVELQNQRAFLLVQHQVHADIAQPGQPVAGGGQAHEAVPVGWLYASYPAGGIRVLADLVVQPGAPEGDAGGQIRAHTHRALVRGGLAAGAACGPAQHGHHGVAEQHYDADVGHPLIADALEDGVGLDPIFDQRPVPVTARRVQPGDDVGQVVLDLVVADDLAGYRAIATF